MPWQEVTMQAQRLAFVRAVLAGEASMSALCRAYGISRKTGYKWLGRYRAEGEAGLVERSRRPHASPRRTAPAVEEAVVAVREAHPAWGGRKIAAYLTRQGMAVVPHASTITAILRRRGYLGVPQPRPGPMQRFEAPEPNSLWQIDFKAPVTLADGSQWPLLTILDDASRYLLVVQAVAEMTLAVVEQALGAAFRSYGLPQRLLKDNGPPWGTADRQRYTRLEAWLLSYGVQPVRSRPYHPQTLGKDERLHRTLLAELGPHLPQTQPDQLPQLLAWWQQVYNEQRPHEALEMAVPADRYRPSPRAWDGQPPQLDYPPGAQLRKVDRQGYLYFQGQRYRVGKGLAGQVVGLVPHPDRPTAWQLFLGSACLTRLTIEEVDQEP